MPLLEVLVIALGLSMDAFAVALGVSASRRRMTFRPTFRLGFHFGLFQFLMPVIGWYLGSRLAGYITSYDHWVAFALLAFVGTRMIREARAPNGDGHAPPPAAAPAPDAPIPRAQDPTRGWSLVMLSVATSIDALAVGLSLAMLRVDIWYPSVVIGVVTGALSVLGTQIGGRLGTALGKRMELAGGALLWLIGLRIVWSHGAGG